MRWLAVVLLCSASAYADPVDGGAPTSVLDDPDRPVDPPDPRLLWWSFPADDNTAIEIDAADLRAYAKPRLGLVRVVESCNQKLAAKLIKARDAGAVTPLRELRLDTPGQTEPRRCVNTLAAFKKRLGAVLTDRIEDELDAHLSFLLPRQRPKPTDPKPEPKP